MFVTNMRNFPLSRGTISGILNGYGGISAEVYTLIYSLVLKGSASKLLLLLTVGLPAVCLVMMFFIRPCTPSGEDSSVHVHFVFVQVASVLLASYLVITTIVSDVVSINDAVTFILVAIMVLLLIAPLAIPIKMTLYPANSKCNVSLVGSSDNLASESDISTQTSPLLTPSSSAAILESFRESGDVSDVEMLIAEGQGAVVQKRRPKRGDDFKFREAFIKADFWLCWFAYFLGAGSGVTVLNNLAQIGVALGVEDTTILLSVFSFCIFIGRLGAGVVSEYFVR